MLLVAIWVQESERLHGVNVYAYLYTPGSFQKIEDVHSFLNNPKGLEGYQCLKHQLSVKSPSQALRTRAYLKVLLDPRDHNSNYVARVRERLSKFKQAHVMSDEQGPLRSFYEDLSEGFVEFGTLTSWDHPGRREDVFEGLSHRMLNWLEQECQDWATTESGV